MLLDLLKSWRDVHKATKYSYEIIFSDDGSSDNTIDILRGEKILPIKILANAHGGAAKARNAAINAAEGRKLVIIGDDIFPEKEFLNKHIEKLQELSITDAVLGECNWHPDIKVNHLMRHITEIGCEQFSYIHFPKYGYTDFRHFYTCNISIDREFLLSEKTFFDEAFYKVNFEDVELGYRLAKKGMKIYYYPEAYGDHYHPYHDIKKFCIRQETAGEMAIVFKSLHEEADSILNIDKIINKWSGFIHEDSPEGINLYEEIVVFCQYVEGKFSVLSDDDLSDLSVIYKKLFSFCYEKGVAQSKINITQLLINKAFISDFFTVEILDSMGRLYSACGIFNYYKILNAINFEDSNNLIIEAVDGEHLACLLNKYGDVSPRLKFSIGSNTALKGMVYRPEKDFYLNKSNIQQILFYLNSHSNINLVILSLGVFDLPDIGIFGALNNCIIRKYDGKHKNDEVKGKVIRIFEHGKAQRANIYNTFDFELKNLDNYGFFGKKELRALTNKVKSNIILFNKSNKPVVFVFPIFIAVGGAERNMAEVINSLQNKYDFVMISFERISEVLGSLHHQFYESCLGVYDLLEMADYSSIQYFLEKLKNLYRPDLIWICNGSPWLENNMKNIRDIFEDIAIVDQQVYDANEGWVRLYKERNENLLSFDRFIAINSKIKEVFIKDAGISKGDIDLIYHVVNTKKFQKNLYINSSNYIKKYNVDVSRDNFIFVGRMNDQKRPLLLIDMVELLTKKHKNFHLFVVGNGPLSDEVDAKIISRGMQGYITRIKHTENVAELYSLMKGLIITSKFEGLPIAMLEAMCMELPTFSTDVGDIDVIINEYRNGLVVRVDSTIRELAEGFDIFYDNISFYKKNSVACAPLIQNRFSETVVSSVYNECFKAAIRSNTI